MSITSSTQMQTQCGLTFCIVNGQTFMSGQGGVLCDGVTGCSVGFQQFPNVLETEGAGMGVASTSVTTTLLTGSIFTSASTTQSNSSFTRTTNTTISTVPTTTSSVNSAATSTLPITTFPAPTAIPAGLTCTGLTCTLNGLEVPTGTNGINCVDFACTYFDLPVPNSDPTPAMASVATGLKGAVICVREGCILDGVYYASGSGGVICLKGVCAVNGQRVHGAVCNGVDRCVVGGGVVVRSGGGVECGGGVCQVMGMSLANCGTGIVGSCASLKLSAGARSQELLFVGTLVLGAMMV